MSRRSTDLMDQSMTENHALEVVPIECDEICPQVTVDDEFGDFASL